MRMDAEIVHALGAARTSARCKLPSGRSLLGSDACEKVGLRVPVGLGLSAWRRRPEGKPAPSTWAGLKQEDRWLLWLGDPIALVRVSLRLIIPLLASAFETETAQQSFIVSPSGKDFHPQLKEDMPA